MDIRRPASNKKKYRQFAAIGGAAIGLIALTWVAVSLASRPVGVDADGLWYAFVQEGEFIHEVSGNGTLVAPDMRAITNRSEGVVERIVVLPGHEASPDDVLVELSSPQLKDDLEDARFELDAAEAEERLRQVQAEDKLIDLRASVASAEADFTSARLELEANEVLLEDQIVSQIEIERDRINVNQLAERLEAERAKLARYPQTRSAEDEAASAKLAQQREKVRRLEEQADDLFVRAGMHGVVREINVEAGERVSAGSDIARIVNPDLLIAQVRVSERDANRVQTGQPVRLQIGREVIAGKVTRIDPTARERVVTVDVELVEEPETSLRPDVSVQARIVLDRVPDTLLLEKPAALRDEQESIELFRVIGGGDRAERVTVEVGRASSQEIEILGGLEPGDEIVLTDMSDYIDQAVVRIRGR